jgi:chemotaxis protein histidine kinase CheA
MSMSDADADFIAEALPAFISEAHEQVAAIEELLLKLEDAPKDRELLDALFRCAHTVKGSAGIFGLDAVVGFTHHVETLLDRLREGEINLTPELSTLLLRCNDRSVASSSVPARTPTRMARPSATAWWACSPATATSRRPARSRHPRPRLPRPAAAAGACR